MSFSTISTFSSLKFSSGKSIIYVYPNTDSSMSIYYTFNFSSNNSIPNYYNSINGKVIYDGTMIGGGIINNNLPNYIIGKGALQLTNTTNTSATQYIQNTNAINTISNNNSLSISIWFNPSSLSSNNLYTLFDIVGNVGNKGIKIDISGMNMICYSYYDMYINNLFFNVDPSMSMYLPLNSTMDGYIPNYYNARQNKVIYDSQILGGGTITNNTNNTIIGNGAVQLTNTNNSNSNTATQYIKNNSMIPTSVINGITISVWFNATNLTNNAIYTLFDIATSTGNKGIQLDLSGTNTLCSELFY
jgi:hypothetical protein